MADYQIVCVLKSTPTHLGHHHIIEVGIGSSAGYEQILTVADVYRWINQGNRFYTHSPSTGRNALVEPWKCCGLHTLRSRPDAIADNNLDNLNACRR